MLDQLKEEFIKLNKLVDAPENVEDSIADDGLADRTLILIDDDERENVTRQQTENRATWDAVSPTVDNFEFQVQHTISCFKYVP